MMFWLRRISEQRQLLKAIKLLGFRVTAVGRDDPPPGYAYSTGFPETFGQPEVIVFGLPDEIMANMIGGLSDQCREGLHLADGLEVTGLLEGHACVLRMVKPENLTDDYFYFSHWYHERQFGSRLEKAFQIVWPGVKTGLFPWEPGCPEEVRLLQPPLYETGTVS